MKTEELCQIFEKLASLYPNDRTFTRSKEDITATIVLWQEALEDVTLDCATRFLKDHVRRSQYMPAVCDFYQFHKQELIDKRMKIESVQESYIGDTENPLLKFAEEAMARINAEKEAKERAKHPPIDPDELFDTTFSDGFIGRFKRAEIEAMMRNGNQNEHGSVTGVKRKAAEKVEEGKQ